MDIINNILQINNVPKAEIIEQKNIPMMNNEFVHILIS